MAGFEAVLVAIELIAVHKLDGRVTYVNPNAIVQLAEPLADGSEFQQLPSEVKCVIGLSGGAHVSVRETCADVRKLFIPEEYRP